MPLGSIARELKRAQQERYAVPLFDAFDMPSVDGMIRALEEKRAPGIIAIYSGALERPNARALAAYVRTRAEEASVPISLMLDHGSSLEHCVRALLYGCTDVMHDGSALPLEENVARTREVARVAHAAGAGVEAELGHVGHGKDYQTFGGQRQGFTDPDTAERFVAETGVDFLAIAIGTAHGLYEGEPNLDLDLLREIRARVDVPLVLHGGSGLTEAQFRAAIEAGICKVNVATDLYVTTGKRLAEAARAGEPSYLDLGKVAVESFQERCGTYVELFGAAGKV